MDIGHMCRYMYNILYSHNFNILKIKILQIYNRFHARFVCKTRNSTETYHFTGVRNLSESVLSNVGVLKSLLNVFN